jgi:nucleoside-diphosphate-sugar epimerase
MSSFSFTPRLPPSSLILITGVNGLVASHLAALALSSGYRVRGTVRSIPKASWMLDHFSALHGPDKFTLVEVPDLSGPGAFDDAVKGCAGIAHVASIVGSPDPNVMIPGVVNGAVSVLESAAREGSVKAVVYTSSSWSASYPYPNKEFNIDQGSWNEEAIKHAWDPPPYGPERIMPVYAASKALAERKCWEWVRERKPGFVFNTILPAANFGGVVSVENQGYPSTIAWVKDLFEGTVNMQPFVPPREFVFGWLRVVC